VLKWVIIFHFVGLSGLATPKVTIVMSFVCEKAHKDLTIAKNVCISFGLITQEILLRN